MSHFTVLVRITADRMKKHNEDLPAALAEMLAPYDEATENPALREFQEDDRCDVDKKTGKKGYWRNPNAKWDWYSIGGRWTGFFPLKPDARVRLGRPGAFGNEPEDGHGDVVRKADIDFDAVSSETLEKLEKFWADWQKFLAGKKFDNFDGLRARAMDLGLLEVVQGPATATTDTVVFPWRGRVPETDDRAAWNDVARVITAEVYWRDYIACFNPIKTYAALDDSGWHAPGRMGWFGCHDAPATETLDYARNFMEKMIHGAADDDWLVVVDCHT